MERVGIAASKIAKGHLFLYNVLVILITFLLTLLLFLVSGSLIVVILIVIAFLTRSGTVPNLQKDWLPVMMMCLKVIFGIVSFLALWALGINLKFKKK